MTSAPPNSPPSPESRERRRALIGVLALVLVLAAVVTPIVVMQYGDDSPTKPTAAPTAEPSEPTEEPEPTDVSEPVQPIMLGDQVYVSPCTLLPLADVERIFGSLGPNGFVVQEYLDDSLSQAQFRAETDDLTGNVRTGCRYNFDDKAESSLDITVEQYRTERVASGKWASIAYMGTGKESRKLARESFSDGFDFVVQLARENERDMGGKPVAGARTKLLYVPGHQDFVMRFGNVVVTARYGTGISVFQDRPLTPKQYARQVPRMKQVLAAVESHWPDHAADQAPLPTAIGGETALGETPYLEPCQILDAVAFEAATGRAPDPGAESTSLIRSPDARFAAAGPAADPYLQTSRSTCSRRVSWPKNQPLRMRHSNAEIEIRYAQDPDTAERLLVRHLVYRYVQDEEARKRAGLSDFLAAKVIRPYTESDADVMYVFDSTPINGRKRRFVDAFFTFGPYEFLLSATRESTGDLYSGKRLTDAEYGVAVDAIIANVQEAMGE